MLTFRASVLIGLAVCSAASRVAPAAEQIAWLTGPAMREQLAAPVSVAWSGNSIAAALERLSGATRVAIVLDRRIDPSRAVAATIDDQPLQTVLERVASQEQLGVAALDGVVYLGPAGAARQLRTLSAIAHEQAALASPARKRALVECRAWSWEALATPRELLAELEREAGTKIERADLVPHDLWRPANLPPVAWIDRLLLVVVQFDLRPEVSAAGATIRLVPLDDQAKLQRVYPGHGHAAATAQRWRRLAPAAKIEVDRDRIVVNASLEDHERLGDSSAGPPVAGAAAAAAPRTEKRVKQKPAGGTQVFRLAVENASVKQLLSELGQRARLEFDYDETALKASGHPLDQLVTFKVSDASLDELLTAALTPAGLSFERKDRRIKILPAPGR